MVQNLGHLHTVIIILTISLPLQLQNKYGVSRAVLETNLTTSSLVLFIVLYKQYLRELLAL